SIRPLPKTQWIKFYLRGWERLTTEPFVPSSADDYQAPDAFVQMPASQTNRIQKLRYLSEPLAQDVTIAGPSVLHLYAAIDQGDRQPIQEGSPHLRRDHEPRRRDRRRRRHQCRVHPLSHLQQQDGAASDLSRSATSFAPAAARDSERLKCFAITSEDPSCPR